MKISKILLCIVVAIVYVRGKGVDGDGEDLKICRKEFGYPDSFYPSHNPIEKKEKCFIACILEKDKMMENGKVSFPEMKKYSSKKYADDRQNTRKKLLDCIEQANKAYDKCEVAASAVKCFGSRDEFFSH